MSPLVSFSFFFMYRMDSFWGSWLAAGATRDLGVLLKTKKPRQVSWPFFGSWKLKD